MNKATFDSLDYATLKRYVTERQQEGPSLEFKLLENKKSFESKDRKKLAEVLSGFANSDGGVVIWGIDAKRESDGIDAARSLCPIDRASAVVSSINDCLHQSTSPGIVGIEVRPIIESNDHGCVAVLVPGTDGEPVMAKSGNDRYYRRIGSSFRAMEHYEIADMFGKRRRPILNLEYIAKSYGVQYDRGHSQYFRVLVYVAIRNSGRGVAKFPALALNCGHDYVYEFGIDGNGLTCPGFMVQS